MYTSHHQLGTAAGGHPAKASWIPRTGELTRSVYSLIKESKYDEAIRVLEHQRQEFPRSRACLSLLGYCYYHSEQFEKAADVYGYLASLEICPPEDNDEYRFHHASALVKAGLYSEAQDLLQAINTERLERNVTLLQCQIHYELGDLSSAQSMLNSFDFFPDDSEKLVLEGAILCRQGKYEEARTKCYMQALNSGYSPGLAYNIAFTYYQQRKYEEAAQHVSEIIERGAREHPELGLGSNTQVIAGNLVDGVGDVPRSVGNSNALRDSALIEALNLKFAIELTNDNLDGAKECLVDMPPRAEAELDPVTLHNIALAYMDEKPSEGFAKLNFLLQSFGTVTSDDDPLSSVPKEAFVNLLHLYCKYGYYDLAADILAENPALTYSCLEPDEYDFFNCLILSQASPEEGFRQFDELARKHVDKLRKITKDVQEGRRSRNNAQIKKSLQDFEEALDQYIPVLMAQAKIYWDMEDYPMVEKLFRQSAEFCSEDETWKLNVAHVFFMQEKFNECIRYYEPFVRRHFPDNVLEITAIVLANLCVAYVMTGANEEAEEIMRAVEKAEEKVAASKGNFEFGISRVMRSLEPMDRKLGMDTWYYAKRCFLALAENMAKQMVVIRDDTYRCILAFFDRAARFGKNMETAVSPVDMSTVVEAQNAAAQAAANAAGQAVGETSGINEATHESSAIAAAAKSAATAAALAAALSNKRKIRTVAYEARMLKLLFLKIYD
ncbi:Tetratricopeptide repeat protein 30A [Perkinsus olseni]|nr:Tetratricopeptide repeat protein 30A [Perkinsus olseni]